MNFHPHPPMLRHAYDRITATRRSRHKRPTIHTSHTDQTAKLKLTPDPTKWWLCRYAGLLDGRVASHSFLSPRRTLACGRLAATVLRRLGLTRLPLITSRYLEPVVAPFPYLIDDFVGCPAKNDFFHKCSRDFRRV